MAGFLKPLVVTPLPDGRFWQTTRDMEYCVGAPDSAVRVVVPTGFETDFASVPRLLWPVLPPTGKYTAAAVVHDWLYQHPWVVLTGLVVTKILNRAECDGIFNEAMQVLSVGTWTRRTVYSGVRVGGWVTWRKYRAKER